MIPQHTSRLARKEARKRKPIDDRRGIYGMYTVIATELSLFVCLFASYYFLGTNKDRWATHEPPKLHYALIMLVVLLSSSWFSTGASSR